MQKKKRNGKEGEMKIQRKFKNYFIVFLRSPSNLMGSCLFFIDKEVHKAQVNDNKMRKPEAYMA